MVKINMSLNTILVSVDEMKEKKEFKGVPYQKYFDAVEKCGMDKWIKEKIESKADKTIMVKIIDVAKELGPAFEKAHFTTIYTGLKYVLFQKGIVIKLGQHKDGDRLFVMREKKPDDKLPSSYKRIENRALTKEKRYVKFCEDLRTKYAKEKEDLKKARLQIDKEKSDILEEFMREKDVMEENFKKEKKSLQEIIKKLKEEVVRRKEKRNYAIEIFKINWKTLEWKLIRQKMVKTEDALLNIIKEFASVSAEDRFRIEITEITDIVNNDIEEKLANSENENTKTGTGQEIDQSLVGINRETNLSTHTKVDVMQNKEVVSQIAK